ncbi:hypothetical protein Stsp01_57650 [Streptomyces sp. NBRC 13847]|nr:hypothetical protein Stsp01_57650 [Streptomyces sp. NBRC 13847]
MPGGVPGLGCAADLSLPESSPALRKSHTGRGASRHKVDITLRSRSAASAHPVTRTRRWRDQEALYRCRCCLTGDGADVSEAGPTPTGGTWGGPRDSDRDKPTNPVVVRIQGCEHALMKLEPEVIARTGSER